MSQVNVALMAHLWLAKNPNLAASSDQAAKTAAAKEQNQSSKQIKAQTKS